MRAVRLIRANGLNERVIGDAGAIRVLDDAEALEMVEVWRLAVYAPEHDPGPHSWSAGAVQEVPVKFVGPEAAAARLDQLVRDQQLPADFVEAYKEETSPQEAAQELVELTEELNLYDEPEKPAPVRPDMRMPWTTASKADWIDWAVHLGAKAEDAALLTKKDLMSRYGERL